MTHYYESGYSPMQVDPAQAPAQHMVHHPHMLNIVEPYMDHALRTLVGQSVVIETSRGTIRGVLVDVSPDYIVLQVSCSHYFVRTQQINWVLPTHQPTHQLTYR